MSTSGPLAFAEVLEAEYRMLHGGQPPPTDTIVGEDTGRRLETAVLEAGHTALCLSGGGIRSASFSIGVLQGLASVGVLDRFHYLSTVSGGGYAGGWFSAWRSREGSGVYPQLAGLSPAGQAEPEPLAPIQRASLTA